MISRLVRMDCECSARGTRAGKAISSRMGLSRRVVAVASRSQRPICRLILSMVKVRLIF